MSKRQLSALLGFWVIIFLFLGIPINWDKLVVAPLTGLLIIFVAYKRVKPRSSANSAFVQNNAGSQTSHTPRQVAPSVSAQNSAEKTAENKPADTQ